MDVIVGFGASHDRLLAAALRGLGHPAEAAAPPGDEALATGRRLMARGHPSAAYYLGGAVVLHARPRGGGLRFVVPGDRCGGYATDLSRALAADGGADVAVTALAPERLDTLWTALSIAPSRGALALAEAVAAGDVLEAAAARRRAHDPRRADAALDAALADVEDALARGSPCDGALRRHTAASTGAPRARVRLTGELLTMRYDRAVGADLARWMAARGVAAEAPSLTEWVLYAAWRRWPGGARYAATRDATMGALHRAADALGVAAPRPTDPEVGAAFARRWLPVSLCAGSGFMELATWHDVNRARSADLVVSLKPFASIVSSAASDAVIHSLARGAATPFLALELNGDLQAQLESRVELALQVATGSPA